MSAVNEAFDTIVHDALDVHVKIALQDACRHLIATGHPHAAKELFGRIDAMVNERIADHFTQLALVRAEKKA